MIRFLLPENEERVPPKKIKILIQILVEALWKDGVPRARTEDSEGYGSAYCILLTMNDREVLNLALAVKLTL